jgi:bifunctional enzyme CysN/CysC
MQWKKRKKKATSNMSIKLENLNTMELVRICTAGSVDDGKSTLIGRLLHDCESIFEDQLLALEKSCTKVGKEVDLAYLLDGLKAEREQGITIDVAYRYFSTPKRRYVIADVPGHEQYTRNMVTGASTANVAMILADARKGLLTQSKRHLFIATLLNIPHILIVVNKMDLVGFNQEVYEKIKKDFSDFAAKLNIKDLQFIPVSAIKGENVVERGPSMPWYTGRTLYDYMENIQIGSDRNLVDFRFPVQYVLRPNQDFRGYAGKVESGSIKVGEKIKVLPSGQSSRVASIYVHGEKATQCFAPHSAVISLEDELDISRGEMIVRENNLADVNTEIEATINWMASEPLEPNKSYFIKHTTRTSRCFVNKIQYRLNIDNLHREEADTLKLNELGRVYIQTNDPLIFDSYQANKNTGNFILIDESTNNTVAAGIIIRKGKITDTVAQTQKAKTNKGAVLWFTGLSGAGKTSVADKLHKALQTMGARSQRLDGDDVRKVLTKDLTFSKEDRVTNIERVSYMAGVISKHDVLVLASFIAPYKENRDMAKSHTHDFVEVFVDASLDTCMKRDVKGMYKKAIAGEIPNFTGVSDPYEAPESPHVHLKTDNTTLDECVDQLITYLKENNYIEIE